MGLTSYGAFAVEILARSSLETVDFFVCFGSGTELAVVFQNRHLFRPYRGFETLGRNALVSDGLVLPSSYPNSPECVDIARTLGSEFDESFAFLGDTAFGFHSVLCFEILVRKLFRLFAN